MIELFADRVESEIGTILLISDGTALLSLDYREDDHRMDRLLVARFGEYTLRDERDPGGASAKLTGYAGGLPRNVIPSLSRDRHDHRDRGDGSTSSP